MMIRILKKWLRRLKWRLFVRSKFHVIYDSDLDSFLKATGLDERIENGEEKCMKCDCEITKRNIYAIKKVEGVFRIICDSFGCTKNMQI